MVASWFEAALKVTKVAVFSYDKAGLRVETMFAK